MESLSEDGSLVGSSNLNAQAQPGLDELTEEEEEDGPPFIEDLAARAPRRKRQDDNDDEEAPECNTPQRRNAVIHVAAAAPSKRKSDDKRKGVSAMKGLERNATKPKDFERLVPRPVVVAVRINGKEARALLP
ncbi:hypothetical protein FRB90_012585 [Tulasnella sp. 427]|nr:hypothetical protein FRB90_012585 [Tulasnella sp. 427]